MSCVHSSPYRHIERRSQSYRPEQNRLEARWYRRTEAKTPDTKLIHGRLLGHPLRFRNRQRALWQGICAALTLTPSTRNSLIRCSNLSCIRTLHPKLKNSAITCFASFGPVTSSRIASPPASMTILKVRKGQQRLSISTSCVICVSASDVGGKMYAYPADNSVTAMCILRKVFLIVWRRCRSSASVKVQAIGRSTDSD